MTRLYHATSLNNLERITQEGLRAGSYWASDQDLLDYYIETVEDEGVEAVVLTIDLKDLVQLAQSQSQDLLPDYPGLEEPITMALGMRESEIHDCWNSSNQSWQDCLDIIKSVKCPVAVPAASLRVLEALSEDIVTLDDHLQQQKSWARRKAAP